ncbi:alpha/beta fold hydrolase [Lichenicoccus sp.]|uniref:alpha/beta fold hydrolase n=1 Tax=Lichenicoccus sp. TaxID=2781899 RepID=UPI003D12C6F2
MTPSLCFARGWAMPPSFWDPVRALLPPELLVEKGATARSVLAVGHSLGLMQLLAVAPHPLAGLIAINGFSRFVRGPDHPDGIDPRILQRLAQRLQRHPAATVAEFRTRCGLAMTEREEPPCDLATLAAGLRLLQEADSRAALAALTCPVLALAGTGDAVATPALSRACFAGLRPLADGQPGLRWVEQGGHILPLSHPQACVAGILDLLAVLG